MKKISFKVQGSSDEPYNVSINKNGNKIKRVCNCGAGVNKMHCKHKSWWPGTESNRRHKPFQGSALPTELPGHSLVSKNNSTFCQIIRGDFDHNLISS